MGWKAKTGKERDVLVSIIALLLSLAALAERAACRSPWVRWRVLWAAWQADLIVRDYFAGSTWNKAGRLWSPVLSTVRYGTEPADALDIAASLRSLALIVQSMAAQLRRLSRMPQASVAAKTSSRLQGIDRIVQAMMNSAFSPVMVYDTS